MDDLSLGMFFMMNPQYTLTDRYATCMKHYEDKLKPFDDVPFKLKHQLERSLLAARSFHEALVFGKNLVTKIMQVA